MCENDVVASAQGDQELRGVAFGLARADEAFPRSSLAAAYACTWSSTAWPIIAFLADDTIAGGGFFLESIGSGSPN